MLRKRLDSPMKWILAYLWATFALSLVGPVRYIDYDWGLVLIFMFFVSLGVAAGFRSKDPASGTCDGRGTRVALLRVVEVALILSLTLEVLLLLSYLAQYSFSNASELLARFLNIGDVYRSSLAAARADTDVNRLRQVITLLGLVKQVAIVGFVWYRQKLRRLAPVFYAFLVLYMTNALVFKGTQKEVGDLLIYAVGAMLLARTYRSGGRQKIGKGAIGASLAAVSLFGFIQVSRAQTYGMSLESYGNRFFTFDGNSIAYKLFGAKVGFATATLAHYVSGGYYGLSKSLSMPFVWTGGLGNSFALSSYANQYLGLPDMLQHSYPFRAQLATGYSATMYWSTAFPWLASDLTWAGTVVAVFLIARAYAIAWREALGFGNFLSVLLVTRLNIFWLFLPANNQLMQTRESVIATVLLVGTWLLFHRRFNVQELESPSLERVNVR